jgi:hypothetical protein
MLEGEIAARFLAAVVSVNPHVAIDGHPGRTAPLRKTSVVRRVTRHIGYGVSQRCRKRTEEAFGWIKASAGLVKVKLRGRAWTLSPSPRPPTIWFGRPSC